MGGRMFMSHGSGVTALVALALGYIVCILAGKEKGILRKAGFLIGISIIAISSMLIVGKILCTLKLCPKLACMSKAEMPMQVPQK